MCGIVGILNLDQRQPIDPAVICAMRDSLAHRGPDDAGIFISAGIGLGHRRLSIIDPAGGRQPMLGANGEVCLTYNGEIYNFKELRTELRSSGVDFRTQSDSEVLLEAYLKWGVGCVSRLTGMFAFAIWDGRSGTLHLVRDRLGVKPILWARFAGQIVFASEVGAFFQHPRFVPEASLDAISSYLTFRQPVDGLTFYRGIHKVAPGHIISVRNGTVTDTAYWTLLPREQAPDRPEAKWVEGASQRLKEAVQRRMVADVPVGAYLSGGLDSAIVVALMAKVSPGSVKTFSIGYSEAPDYDESGYARRVAAHCGTDHYHLDIRQNAYIDLWQRLVEHRGVPLSIPHEVALYQLSALMKEQVTVALSGEGADELFGGYGRVQRSPMDWKKVAVARALMGSRMARLLANCIPSRHATFAQLACENHLEHFFHSYHWMPFAEKWDLMTQDALSSIDCDARTIAFFREVFDAMEETDPYDRVLYVFERVHLSCLLDRLDAISMAAGIEARVPFVDHDLVRFVTNMPFHYKLRWNSPLARCRGLFYSASEVSERLDTTKYMLRQVSAPFLPREIATRKKLGFPTPLDIWMNRGLQHLAREVLLSPRALARGIFEPRKLRQFLDRNQNLPYDFYGKKVWMLLNIEIWMRTAIDQRAVRPITPPSALPIQHLQAGVGN